MRIMFFAAVLGGVAASAAQTQPVSSGEQVYRAHCASCHGEKGKGDGPAAESMRMRPTDLTQLAKRNRGEFPTYRVEKLLGSGELAAHGSKRMPVWGPLLGSGKPGSQEQIRVRSLLDHLKTLQPND